MVMLQVKIVIAELSVIQPRPWGSHKKSSFRAYRRKNLDRFILKVFSAEPEASTLKSLVGELKNIETAIEELESKKKELKAKRMRDTIKKIEPDLIINNIRHIKSRKFDEKTLNLKKDFLQQNIGVCSYSPR